MIVPIIGQARSWKDLVFKYGVILQPNVDPAGEPSVIGWQIGVFATRSDDVPFASQFTLDTAKITKDPIATTLTIIDMAIVQLESFRECSCVPGHACLVHAKTPGFKN
jgi:hypothetical protein